jgi:hypothetical protein
VKSRLVIIASVVVLGVAILVTVPSGASSTKSHQVRSHDLAPASPELPNAPTAAAANELGPSLAAQFQSQYGGISLSNDNATINIYVTSQSPQLIKAVSIIAPSGSINYVPVANSWSDLTTLQKLIEDSISELGSEGINVAGLYIDPSLNRVVIDVGNATPSETDYLEKRFGVNKLLVDGVPSAGMGVPLTSRTSDFSPYNAGDNMTSIHSSTYYQCSTGFSMALSGVSHILTAAHCFPSGASVSNELFNTDTNTVVGGGRSMGTISAVDTTASGTDSEYLSGAGSFLLTIGAIGSPVSEYVHGLAGVTAGETGICASGGLSGQVCGITVKTTSNCLTNLYYLNSSWSEVTRTACNLIRVYTSGAAIAGQGDSGGPMYVVSGGNYYGIGLISTGYSGDTATCPANAWAARTCYWDIYYTSLSSVLNHFGGTLVTGP